MGYKKSTKIILGVALISIVLLVLQNPIKKALKSSLGGYKWFDESLKWYRDEKTKNIVETLHPKIVDEFKEFISRVEKELGLQIIATSGYRTWKKQAALKKANPKNAAAGDSDHNYGFALDINVLNKDGKNILRKATSKKKWEDSGIVKMAKNMGFKWGGDFSNYHDPIHFYKQPISKGEMKREYLAGNIDNKGYIKIA
jgi:peptidoglycan L-alanyl-D-glutamate endopeptidase CwlK|tara:strand:+ start:1380 stop:1976 length:597 start_codon:yes stop_codon:yes gene_type:complete